jgi:hypothetical protein
MDLIANSHIVRRDLAGRGFTWISHTDWLIGPLLAPFWQDMRRDWDHLERDEYLANGATFRRRRYGRYCWSPWSQKLLPLTSEPYFQSEEENTYAGGIERAFAPLQPHTVDNPFLHALVHSTFACLPLDELKRREAWEVRIHQIRIVASPDQPGLPAPEGIHQDGTEFLTLHLVHRHNIIGGESTIYDLDRKPLQHFTLLESLDSLILEDARVMHGVTPVLPADGCTLGTRDILGVDFLYRPQLQRPA